MKLKTNLMLLVFAMSCFVVTAQRKTNGPSKTGYLSSPIIIPSIADQIKNGTAKFADPSYDGKEAPPKMHVTPNIVPGKGSVGPDLALQTTAPLYPGRAPILVFDADTNTITGPADCTGATGPNHYMGGWNFAFRIFDKSGNPLTPEMAWSSVITGNNIGDGVLLFDPYIDNEPGEPRGRFIITEFDDNPNGFAMAICMGPDPVNDGWYLYNNQFNTGAFPDYTKFSIWSDGYYVTGNNLGGPKECFAVERLEMAKGEPAQFAQFTYPGIVTSGFYSSQGFSMTGGSEPPYGNFSIVYEQDDAWGGVTDDHLKIWTINMDWEDIGNSTISTPQEIPTADFIGVFDNGSFANLDQPGGPDLDALQATIMNQAHFREFDGYNSAVFNFVVDTDPGGGELAGVRWYELRQDAAGDPWSIFQEGTYTPPAGRHAFAGSMAMDIQGNIGLAYSSVSTTEMISQRYTGRLSSDPVGDMTLSEQLIIQSTANSPQTRFQDYVQLSIDPEDDRTFWHIAQYYGPNSRNVVGVFDVENTLPALDVAINDLLPNSATILTASEEIVVTIQNYGSTTVTSVPVSYSVDGGTVISETYTGSIAAGASDTYTFTVPANLTGIGVHRISTRTDLPGDEFTANDVYNENVVSGTPLGVNDLSIAGAELIVISKDNKNFDITLYSDYSKNLRLEVYDISGKLLAINTLLNEGNKYFYRLDMSYVASGVYIVNLGNDDITKSTKIIVK